MKLIEQVLIFGILQHMETKKYTARKDLGTSWACRYSKNPHIRTYNFGVQAEQILIFWGISSNKQADQVLIFKSDSIRGTATVLICYNCKAFTKNVKLCCRKMSCIKKTVLMIFKCTISVTVSVTTGKVYGMNNIVTQPFLTFLTQMQW